MTELWNKLLRLLGHKKSYDEIVRQFVRARDELVELQDDLINETNDLDDQITLLTDRRAACEAQWSKAAATRHKLSELLLA